MQAYGFSYFLQLYLERKLFLVFFFAYAAFTVSFIVQFKVFPTLSGLMGSIKTDIEMHLCLYHFCELLMDLASLSLHNPNILFPKLSTKSPAPKG